MPRAAVVQHTPPRVSRSRPRCGCGTAPRSAAARPAPRHPPRQHTCAVRSARIPTTRLAVLARGQAHPAREEEQRGPLRAQAAALSCARAVCFIRHLGHVVHQRRRHDAVHAVEARRGRRVRRRARQALPSCVRVRLAVVDEPDERCKVGRQRAHAAVAGRPHDVVPPAAAVPQRGVLRGNEAQHAAHVLVRRPAVARHGVRKSWYVKQVRLPGVERAHVRVAQQLLKKGPVRWARAMGGTIDELA